MGEDASLEDFLGDDDEPSDDSASATPSDEEPAEEPASDTESAENPAATDDGPAADDGPTPAMTTYAWDGDGAACGSCGEVVERRWQQDGALVCVACKSW